MLFFGFNLTFFPMHLLGLKGMTRRIYTYPLEMGWAPANAVATVGAGVIAVGGLLFLINVIRSCRSGLVAGNDPWGAGTLEWAAASPPENYNFARLPVVSDRYPMWTPIENGAEVSDMRTDRREVLITAAVDAEPQYRHVLPSSTIWPFLTAVGATIGLAGSVIAFSWYFVALALGGIGLLGWFWPRRPVEAEG